MRSRLSILGLGLLSSSLFLSPVLAATQRTTPPTLRSSMHVAARISQTQRPATQARSTTRQKPTLVTRTAEPTLKLAAHQQRGLATVGGAKFGKLLKLFGAPRADIKNGDPTTKEGAMQVKAGGKTFVNGVSFKDVDQGHLGDCYFVAALTAVAFAHPELIQKNLVENADGSLSLRMYHQVAGGAFEADMINMTKSIPMANGSPSFAHGSDPTQMWPAYFQKGFVMQKAATGGKTNAYPSIEGGFPGDAFATLTGKPSQRFNVNAQVGDQLYDVIAKATAGKSPVAAWTPNTLPEGLVHANHSYTVLGVSQHDGKKFVKLRNPWGFSPGNDGMFELDMPTFAKTFVGMDVGG